MSASEPLPLPEPKIPENPPFPPMVITAGGQRLLLEHTDVEVRYDQDARMLEVNRPGWWVINHPLTGIAGLEGKSENEIARLIFGRPAREITNYYVRSPGESAPEPVKPTGPAPIELHSQPTLIVDQHHAFSSDENPGTGDAPLKTISTAVARAQPGKSGLHRYARWANADFGKAVETSSQMGGDEGMPQFESPERENYRFPNTHNDANAGVPELRFTTQGREIHLPSLVRHDFNGLLRFPEDGVPVGAFRNEPKTPVGAQTQIEIEWRDGTMERRWIPK